ncbi:hypothetical protein AY601_0441 [Pedobacter cryoconitis]|uniref:Glycosyl transferase family 25 domain-containing protein n=1 Tax=Pedobacter cryoconitis TaxID=188932 RepID=A0A127V825_9SPHI|nr:glycosyltransferase family 25 protein [Pedobacter cryoconitis]AMP97397.1 hypothetical protein AY601_0441 [Pedobacter cryoconitis]
MLPVIKTYAINLKHRTDRKAHIQAQFEGRKEFDLKIIEACEAQIGAVGLWNSVLYILGNVADRNDEYIIICEDDHQFTANYSPELFISCIEQARAKGADILCGGVSWLNCAIQISKELFWVEKFTGGQFIVIFNKFTPFLLSAVFKDSDCYDLVISSLTNQKFIIHPFISTQKEFGYSDVTEINSIEGRVNGLFNKTSASVQILKDVSAFYKKSQDKINQANHVAVIKDMVIPTYIINLKDRTARREHIEKQFENRPEFDFSVIEACEHEIGAVGLWNSIRKIIEIAQSNEDDVIIICEDDHEFTSDYSSDLLMKNIIEAYQQGIEVLSGGIGGFGAIIPVTRNRLWVNAFLSTQFIIVYKRIFQKILDAPFDDKVVADGAISEIADNKMVLYPFISVQKDFGYSDVTAVHNTNSGLVNTMFEDTSMRIQNIYSAMDVLFEEMIVVSV